MAGGGAASVFLFREALEVGAALVLECQQAATVALPVATDAPIHSRLAFQGMVKSAPARAVGVPYLVAFPRGFPVGLIVLLKLAAGVPEFPVKTVAGGGAFLHAPILARGRIWGKRRVRGG